MDLEANSSNTSLDPLPGHIVTSDAESGTEYLPSGEESINLEYDDYPLDLVAPVAGETNQESTPMLSSWIADSTDDLWKLPPPSCNQYEEVVLRKKDTNNDIVITEEMITDYGRRSWCDYQLRDSQLVDGEEDVFIPGQRLSALIQARRESPPEYLEAAAAGELAREEYKRKWRLQYKCKACCHSIVHRVAHACLTKYNPLPAKPSFCQRFRYAFLCPPHGKLAKYFSYSLGVVFAWFIIWSLCGQRALLVEEGDLGTVFVLLVLGYVVGAIITLIKLPSYVGMVLAGIVVRKVFPVVNLAPPSPMVASVTRKLALSLVLLLTGMRLRTKRRVCIRAIRVAITPSLVTVIIVCVATHSLSRIPWLWALFTGFLVTAMCPVQIQKHCATLQARGLGVDDNIPMMISSATAIQSPILISAMLVLGKVIQTQGSVVLPAVLGPAECVVGGLVGACLGFLFCYIPNRRQKQSYSVRTALLVLSSSACVLGSSATGFPAAGPVACMVIGIICGNYKPEKYQKSPLTAIHNFYSTLEPLLFALLGYECDFSMFTPTLIGINFGVALLSTAISMVTSHLCCFGMGLNLKERVFVPCAMLPSSTIQATIGVFALEIASSTDEIAMANNIVVICILILLIRAPLSGPAIPRLGRKLLKCSKVYRDHLQKQQAVIEDNVPPRKEITTEMEASL